MTAHTTTITRRGSGWGYRCSCGEAPNRSTKVRREAERWAQVHEHSHRADDEPGAFGLPSRREYREQADRLFRQLREGS